MLTRTISAAFMLTAIGAEAFAASGVGTIHYVPSSGSYEDAIGFGFYKLESDPVGLYGNFSVTSREREPHYDNLNTASFGDPITERFKELTVFAIGPTRELSDNLSIYAGLGYAWGDAKAEKRDPTRILASDGEYYVDDPSNDESGANLNAGVFFTPTQQFTVELGYHSFPSAPYVGIGWKF